MRETYLDFESSLESRRKETTKWSDDRAEHAQRQRMQDEWIHDESFVDIDLWKRKKHKLYEQQQPRNFYQSSKLTSDSEYSCGLNK